jgi:phage shock protein E
MKRYGFLLIFGLAVAALAGARQSLSSAELAEMMGREQDAPILIDVRTPAEYAAGHIPGAVNIPYDLLAGTLPTEDREAPVVVYCRSGRRSAIAKKTLESLGFTRVEDFGGIDRWAGELVFPD